MAEEPIRKEDIIDIDGILAGIQMIMDALNAVLEIKKKLIADSKNTLQGANPSTPEGQNAIKQTTADIDAAIPELKAYNVLLQELARRKEELAGKTGLSNKEFAAQTRALGAAGKAMSGVKKETEVAAGSLTDLERQLAKLKKAWKDADPAVRGSTVNIDKLDKEVKKLNADLGNHQREVGNYRLALQNVGASLKSAAFNMISFGSVSAVAMSIIRKLKEAFIATVEGMNIMNVVGAASKQMFYDLATSGKINFENMANAAKAAKLLNDIRAGDRADMVEFAQLERQISKLELEAADRTKGHAVSAAALNKAIITQNKLSDKRIADAWEELQAVELALSKAPRNEALLNKQAELKTKIIQLDDQRFSSMRRNEARSTAFEKEETDRIKKQHDDLMKAAEEEIEILDEKDKKAKAIHDKSAKDHRDQEIIADKEAGDFIASEVARMEKAADDKWNTEVEFQREIFKSKQDAAKAEWDLMLETEEKKKKQDEDELERRRAIVDQAFQFISGSLNSLSALYEANKQRELSAAGSNAVEREKIEREYAKKQQQLAIGQAVVDTAMAVIGIWRKWAPINVVLAAIFSGIAIAQMGLQLAVIKSQKFAEGGEIKGKSHAQGGTMIEAERGEYVIKKHSTDKYRKLIEAINEDNPMRIAEEIRNRHFHTVWGGVSAQLSTISKQDPYTRLTYELLKKKPEIYTDSNGDTNLVYPDGSRRIIRKYQS